MESSKQQIGQVWLWGPVFRQAQAPWQAEDNPRLLPLAELRGPATVRKGGERALPQSREPRRQRGGPATSPGGRLSSESCGPGA